MKICFLPIHIHKHCLFSTKQNSNQQEHGREKLQYTEKIENMFLNHIGMHEPMSFGFKSYLSTKKTQTRQKKTKTQISFKDQFFFVFIFIYTISTK